MYVCVYVCVRAYVLDVCLYVCLCVCMYVRAQMCPCVSRCMCVCMCVHMHVSKCVCVWVCVLKERDDSYVYEFDVSGAQCVAESAKGFSMAYKNKLCVEFREDWQKLKSQGRVARETKDCVNSRGSGNFLQNPKVQLCYCQCGSAFNFCQSS